MVRHNPTSFLASTTLAAFLATTPAATADTPVVQPIGTPVSSTEILHEVTHLLETPSPTQKSLAEEVPSIKNPSPKNTTSSTSHDWYETLMSVPGEKESLGWYLGWLYKIAFLAVLWAYYPTYRGIRKNGQTINVETWLTFGSVNLTGLIYGIVSGNVPLIFTMTPASLWCGAIVMADHKEKKTWEQLNTVIGIVKERYKDILPEIIATEHARMMQSIAEVGSKFKIVRVPEEFPPPASPLENERCFESCLAHLHTSLKVRLLQYRGQKELDNEDDSVIPECIKHLYAGICTNSIDKELQIRIENLIRALHENQPKAWQEIHGQILAGMGNYFSNGKNTDIGIPPYLRSETLRDRTNTQAQAPA